MAGSLALSQMQVRAAEFDTAVKALLQSSYDNLQTATDCEAVIGSSRYWQAQAAVENALRAAGYSAENALEETDESARRAKQPNAWKPRTSVAECLADYIQTSRELLRQHELIRDRKR